MKTHSDNHMTDELLNQAITQFGMDSQIVKTCEELAELTQVLCKALGNDCIEDESIIDELADVYIMLRQVELIFEFSAQTLTKRIDYKLARLAQRIQSDGDALGI